jgi:hypothetical protein
MCLMSEYYFASLQLLPSLCEHGIFEELGVMSHGGRRRKGHKEPLLKLTNVEPALGVETLGNGVRAAETVFSTF